MFTVRRDEAYYYQLLNEVMAIDSLGHELYPFIRV